MCSKASQAVLSAPLTVYFPKLMIDRFLVRPQVTVCKRTECEIDTKTHTHLALKTFKAGCGNEIAMHFSTFTRVYCGGALARHHPSFLLSQSGTAFNPVI